VPKTRVRPHAARILVASLAALALSAALLQNPAHSGGATAATQPSSNVAVIPGFAPKAYSGNAGVPPLPVTAPELANYHFSQLSASQVTAATLNGYDTVLLYGIKWSDIPSAGQAAINAFAATHKVVIWDADATGPQTYSTFVHPFSTLSSGQNFKGKPNQSVVSFPTGVDFLASNDPTSPYYISPYQLVKDGDEINDMNAMVSGTKDWVPALIAANANIPDGGWALAWSYGDIADATGMTIYSGIDADSFVATGWKTNNGKKELALDLAAPFRSAPQSSCAPNCGLPSPSAGQPFARCSFAKPLPRHWVHGRVTFALNTSLATGITGQIVTHSGRAIAKSKAQSGGLVRLVVRTKKLPSNRRSKLRAVIFFNGKQACTLPFKLKVDNVRPRVLFLQTARGSGNLLSLRVSEKSSLTIVGLHVSWRTRLIAAHRTVHFHLPSAVRNARLILRDRAGNTVIRRLFWH
jgi:hypothetical protein